MYLPNLFYKKKLGYFKQGNYFWGNLEFMAKEKVLEDVRDLIMDKMNGEGRVLTWLSSQTGIPYDTLNSCLKRKLFSLNDDNLTKINKALETNFTQNGTGK